MKTKSRRETLFEWLEWNLGDRCLAPLTGTDTRALVAAAEIVELWSHSKTRDVALAFGAVVHQMQESTRFLAFHAIACVCDWSFRETLWNDAMLQPLAHPRVAAFSPEGWEHPQCIQRRKELAAIEDAKRERKAARDAARATARVRADSPKQWRAQGF